LLGYAAPFLVIAGLDPAIHEAERQRNALRKTFICRGSSWMPGSSPGMTAERASGVGGNVMADYVSPICHRFSKAVRIHGSSNSIACAIHRWAWDWYGCRCWERVH
jgi:hypothetical protein